MIIQQIKSVVNKFSSSHVLTSKLVQATGVGLVSFCDTRWNYVYLVLGRILRVRDELTEILKSLEPFHRYTNMAAKEHQAVSSEVVPTILSLYVHLDEYQAKEKFKVVATKIKERMKAKFSNWFYEQNNDIESSYLVATFLDPRYRMILPVDCKDLAKKYLVREYRLLNSRDSELENSLSCPESQSSTVLSRFPLVQKMKNTLLMLHNSSEERNDDIEAEVHKYAGNQSYDKLCDADEVFNFWLGKMEEYPCLAPLALDYISIPDSSGHVERVFGTSSAFTKGVMVLEGIYDP
ncbi:unnamed protein product [Allacma fusca]|uniref:HAT C-terminal dimerisation domain-containing protein n=1 Tax=Allacma fusca TaxID=39272 RepID=A0A8J2L5F6_9HEXA|nr:unnamed protein product [Allacma fusca]